MSLKLRDKAYQREQSNLRNSITVIRFQIEKIKESIENAKRNELEQLKEFEKAVDEITEKFRSAPAIYVSHCEKLLENSFLFLRSEESARYIPFRTAFWISFLIRIAEAFRKKWRRKGRKENCFCKR